MRIRIHNKSVKSKMVEKIEKISGQNVFSCYQCGACSASCPMITVMDVMPNQAMKMIQMGDEAVLDTQTMWLCASCHTCSVRCPREIDLSAVMEALRQVQLRANVNQVEPSQIPLEEMKEMPQIALVCNFRKMTR